MLRTLFAMLFAYAAYWSFKPRGKAFNERKWFDWWFFRAGAFGLPFGLWVGYGNSPLAQAPR